MSKRTTFTTITPLPAGISREAVLDFLHNHLEMIDLNPLIKERHVIKPPAHAPPEEHSCVWYSLTDEISYLPGGLATGDVSYTCAFHDLPNGLQTHCYAPMGLEIRDKWTVAGSLPGEPVEPVELGIGAPLTGLYIREDVDMRCNVFTTSFVKKTLKKSHGMLVDRLKTKCQRLSVAAAHQRHASQTSLSSYHSIVNSHSHSHSRHASQNSLSGAACGSGSGSGSFHSGSSPNSSLHHLPPLPMHRAPSYAALGNQLSLPYRPSYPKTSPPPAGGGGGGDCGGGHPNAFPEPLRIRHAQKPSWPDIKSQQGVLGNYTHAHYSDLNGGGGAPYDVKTTPPPPPPKSGSPSPCVAAGDAKQRPGRQQAKLNGPFVAELE